MWELWQVDGLAGGRWAVDREGASRDGRRAVRDRRGSDDARPGAGVARRAPGARAGDLRPPLSRGALAVSGATWVLALPFRLIRLVLRAVLSPGRARRAVQDVRAGLAAVVRPDLPPSILNGPLCGERLWGWTGIDLAPLAQLRAGDRMLRQRHLPHRPHGWAAPLPAGAG